MTTYFLKRLALIIPTIFGIMLINFVIIQLAPGGPVDQMIAKIKGAEVSSLNRITSAGGDLVKSSTTNTQNDYASNKGIDPKLIEDLKKQYGFDKPLLARFWQMCGNYLRFDFGQSFYQNSSVINLILDKLPVSISLGLWSTVLLYLIAVPLGIRKAVKNGSRFDVST
ncbi:MAG: microcin ABC transporter permease, partial [Pirellulaceae bacterium]